MRVVGAEIRTETKAMLLGSVPTRSHLRRQLLEASSVA
jgi:hypothetical protein